MDRSVLVGGEPGPRGFTEDLASANGGLRFEAEDLRQLRYAALLHDFGKLDGFWDCIVA